jgi:hypothetical protein
MNILKTVLGILSRLVKQNNGVFYINGPDTLPPPLSPEEEQEHHEHTAFYRWLIRLRDRVRHLFRRILYRNHGKSKSLRMWVKMKLSVRSVKHKVSHTLHHDSLKERQAQESAPKKESEEQNPASADTTEAPTKESDLQNNDTKEADSNSEN